MTYTQDFASRIPGLPYTAESPRWKIITNHNSSFKNFIDDRDNWFAKEYKGNRQQYTGEEMLPHWDHLIKCKQRIECFWQVAIGKFKSWHEAEQTLFS